MSRFVDVYLDACVPGFPCVSSPRWSTEIAQVDSGAEQVSQRWQHPLHRFTLPEAVRDMDVFNAIRDHWMVMRGPLHTWPFRDPLDFASVNLDAPDTVPEITALDQPVGIGDGLRQRWPLMRRYARGPQSYTRRIELPLVPSVMVAVDGIVMPAAGNWSVTRPGGELTFSEAPVPGAVITAGYLFDCIVRFEGDDAFDGIMRTFTLGGFSDITLFECRSC